jgi:hypothetical protein
MKYDEDAVCDVQYGEIIPLGNVPDSSAKWHEAMEEQMKEGE